MATTTVLITGAAGGLGSELAAACAVAGFAIVLLDRDKRALERLYDRIVDSGAAEPVLHPLDLAAAGPEEFAQMVAAIKTEFGGLDAVVHCAARFEGLTPLDHVPPAEWLAHLQVNLNAAWLLSVQCLPSLRQSGRGRLYFMLEDLPKVAGPLWGPYGVSKHALRALVSQLAGECESSAVQVLGINPGPMRSELRSRVYLAEHPASLPLPQTVARKILELLLGEREPSGVFLDLGEAPGDASA